ncbi:hypothetical protein [Lactobacillus iners]|nr:hypothetical protein [Lactobacillus crispatus]
MLQGRVEDKDLVFNIGNIADPSSKKWTFLVLEPYIWSQPDNQYYQLKSICRSRRSFSLSDSSVSITFHDSDFVDFKAEYNDEQFRIKELKNGGKHSYLTLVAK